MKKMIVLLVALCCLIMSCATGVQESPQFTTRPFDSKAWWGMDPTCSPGCPAGQPSGW